MQHTIATVAIVNNGNIQFFFKKGRSYNYKRKIMDSHKRFSPLFITKNEK